MCSARQPLDCFQPWQKYTMSALDISLMLSPSSHTGSLSGSSMESIRHTAAPYLLRTSISTHLRSLIKSSVVLPAIGWEIKRFNLCSFLRRSHAIFRRAYSAIRSASAIPSSAFRLLGVRNNDTSGKSLWHTLTALFLSPVTPNSRFHFWGVTNS